MQVFNPDVAEILLSLQRLNLQVGESVHRLTLCAKPEVLLYCTDILATTDIDMTPDEKILRQSSRSLR
jgi:hypothetical protein